MENTMNDVIEDENQEPEGGRQSAVDAIVKRMGLEEVEDELDANDVCEKCGEHPQRLFFGMRDYWDFREGEYWCADCIVKRYEADQKWIKEMDAKLEAECA